MSDTLMQLQIDERLKAEAEAVFEELGLDLSTAIRVFLIRSVQEGGIPFEMKVKKNEYKAEDAVEAMKLMSAKAKENQVSDMTLEEINAEITAVRGGK